MLDTDRAWKELLELMRELVSRRQEEAQRTLLVKIHNYLYRISDGELNQVFSPIGNLESIEIFDHGSQFHSRVRFQERELAVKAIEVYNGRYIYDGGCCQMELSLEVPTSDPLSKIEEQIEGFEPGFGPSKFEALSNLEDAKAEETQFSAPTSLRDGVTPFNSGEDWTTSDAQEFPEETKDSVTEDDADLLVLSDSSGEDLSPSLAKEKLSRIEPSVEVSTHETIPGQFVQVVKESILDAYNLFDEMPRKKSVVFEPSKVYFYPLPVVSEIASVKMDVVLLADAIEFLEFSYAHKVLEKMSKNDIDGVFFSLLLKVD